MLSVMESANVPEPQNDIAALSNHELNDATFSDGLGHLVNDSRASKM